MVPSVDSTNDLVGSTLDFDVVITAEDFPHTVNVFLAVHDAQVATPPILVGHGINPRPHGRSPARAWGAFPTMVTSGM